MKTNAQQRWGIALAGVVLAACSTATDQAGGETVVLHLASIDPINDNGQSYGPQAFIDALAELSDGQLQVEVTEAFGDGLGVGEVQLVEAIAAGEVDGGWPSTRSFAAAGIHGLEAVEAPFTIVNYEAEAALVSGPTGATVLSGLDGSDVIGVGLAVGPLRRPFAVAEPLLGPADWDGTRVRVISNSTVQVAVVEALGGTPVNLVGDWSVAADNGEIDALEFDIAQYSESGRRAEAGIITANVVLWPKVFVFTLNRALFEGLSQEQQGWVREAAAAGTQASVEGDHDETPLAQRLCDGGARFLNASPQQVAALQEAVAPVYDAIAAEPHGAAVLEELRAIAASHPGVATPAVPAACQQLSTVVAEEEPEIPTEVSALPDGVYRVELTADDIAAAQVNNGPGFGGTWTLFVEDGTFRLACELLDQPSDCGNSGQGGTFEWGDLRGTGQTVHFVGDDDDAAAPGPMGGYSMTWQVDGEQLTFSDYAPDSADALSDNWTFVLEPWVRVG